MYLALTNKELDTLAVFVKTAYPSVEHICPKGALYIRFLRTITGSGTSKSYVMSRVNTLNVFLHNIILKMIITAIWIILNLILKVATITITMRILLVRKFDIELKGDPLEVTIKESAFSGPWENIEVIRTPFSSRSESVFNIQSAYCFGHYQFA